MFIVGDPLKFQFQVVNGLLQKPTATVTFKFDIRYHNFAEH